MNSGLLPLKTRRYVIVASSAARRNSGPNRMAAHESSPYQQQDPRLERRMRFMVLEGYAEGIRGYPGESWERC